MLHLHFSNRHERLAGRLVDELSRSDIGVFECERVLVPSAAWQRWLSLELAHRLGVCAQIDFGFLGPWLWRELAPGHPLRTPPPDTERLAWRTWAWLGAPATLDRHPVLAHWLNGPGGRSGRDAELARYELARRAAALIEQVETWRPRWRQAWQIGRSALTHSRQPNNAQRQPNGAQHQPNSAQHQHEAWQADLWRHLRLDLPASPEQGDTPPAPGTTAPDAGSPANTVLPTVHLFAPASMPPQHLAALRSLAGRFEIHAYLANPCREYWFDLVSPRRFAHLAARGRLAGHEIGHALLARWGAAAQAQLAQWHQLAGEEQVQDDGDYVSAAESAAAPGHSPTLATPASAAPSLLAQVQDSLLDLAEPGPGGFVLDASDRSLELHLCHTRQRELEVLLDRVLALMAADPTLEPGQVWVAVTDLDAAAPMIEAVWGAARGVRALPFAITGRSQNQSDPSARCLLALLDLAASRCTTTDLLAVLQLPPVAGALGLDDDALADASDTLTAAGLRWGLDEAHLARHGAPPHGHTLSDALARMALGACLPADTTPLVAAALRGDLRSDLGAGAGSDSADDAWGADPGLPWPSKVPAGQAGLRLVGALWRWCEGLRWLADALTQPCSAGTWRRRLDHLLETQLARPSDLAGQASRQALRQTLAAVCGQAAEVLGPQPLPWSVLREALVAALDNPARGGVASGAVTFSALAPLRGLPFRVVALIGLDDGLFPGAPRVPEFDLVAAFPEPGDRQRRLDDRGLVLEALLACRETLHLSCIGRSALDNSPRPPSAVVSELFEWLLPAVARAPHDAAALAAARGRLVVEQPLQAFDLHHYDREADPRLRSSEPSAHAAWQARLAAAAAALVDRAPPAAAGDVSDSPAAAGDVSDSPAAVGDGDDDASESPSGEDGAEEGFDDTPTEDSDCAAAPDGADPDSPRFLDASLPPGTSAPPVALTLAELLAWLLHPARHWLRRRLGLAISYDAPEPEDDEVLNGGGRPERRALWHHWMPLLLASPPPSGRQAADGLTDTAAAWTRHAAVGPGGALGRVWLQTEWPALRAFAADIAAAHRAVEVSHGAHPVTAGAPAWVELELPPWTPPAALATGIVDLRHDPASRLARWHGDLLARGGANEPVRLSGPAPAGPQALLWHMAERNGRHVAEAWLQHLFASASSAGRWPCDRVQTLLITAPPELPRPPTTSVHTRWRGLDPATALQQLALLATLYRASWSSPLPLPPKSAWVWVESEGLPGQVSRTRAVWLAGERQPFAEGADASWRLVLRGQADPVPGAAFAALAEAVYGPARAAVETDEPAVAAASAAGGRPA